MEKRKIFFCTRKKGSEGTREWRGKACSSEPLPINLLCGVFTGLDGIKQSLSKIMYLLSK